MNDPFILIENKLRDFFENHIQNLGKKDLFTEITQGVVETIQTNVFIRGSNQFAPNIFRIYFGADKELTKSDRAEFSSTLKEIIKEFCVDQSLNLAGPLHIQFFQNKKSSDALTIETSFSAAQRIDTAVISSERDKRAPQIQKIKGYLISPSGEIHDLKKKVTNIGRQENNELVVDNLLVSRLHAQIREINSQHILFDIDSTAGTMVNGKKIHQHTLNHGDVIEIADTALVYYTELNESQLNKTDRITR